MSEYYARGRAVFADASSFAFFIAGFLGAGPFAWPALRTAFEAGQYDRGLAVFIGRIFGSGLAAGLFGYVIGALAGRLWQALHQWRRARRAARVAASEVPAVAEPASSHTTDVTAQATTASSARRAPAALSCRAGPLTPTNLDAFSRRLARGPLDARYAETTSAEIVTLAAWDGLDIAGVARLWSDDRGALVITDVVVDPYYDPNAVEEHLMSFAHERVPRGGRLTRI